MPAQSRPAPSPPTTKFETPQDWDPLTREQIQRQAKENTERFRTRVVLPRGAFENRPAADAAGPDDPIGGPITPGFVGRYAFKFLGAILAVIVWYMLARKLAPEFAESMVAWLRPRAMPPVMATERLVTLLAEEKSVSEFQAALRGGSRVPGPGEAEESVDSQTAEASPFAAAAGHVRALRRLLEEAVRSLAESSQRSLLLEALAQIRPLKDLARPAEMLPLWQMTGAMEMLIKQLTEKAGNITSSTLRTSALGVALLEELCQPGLKSDLLNDPPLRLLVVDDETFSRYALAHSLKRGLCEPNVAESGEAALAMAARHAYDLILLDVQMPGMDGFELCSKIHETVVNRNTPVVFVTSLRDFDARANSILCGGRDLIAKPFLTFELTVKALTVIAGERLRGRVRLADAAVEEVIATAPAAQLPETPRPFAGAPVAAKSETPAAPEPERTAPVRATTPDGEASATRLEPAGSFFVHARAQIGLMLELVTLIRNAPEPEVQRTMLGDLTTGVHLLAANAEASQQPSIGLLAATLEGLLKRLRKNPSDLSASTLDAVALSATLIQDLCVKEPSFDLAFAPPIRALVVDDDPVTLRAVSNALQMRFSKPETASDGKSATAMAATTPFDVIFLDVQMPDMDGFEACCRIRETTANRHTPIVFLTSHDTAAMRARSEVCGGNDFLTKPCLGSELTLKALAFALRGRLKNGAAPALQCAA